MDLDKNCYVMPDGTCRSPWTCVHGPGVPWVQIDLNSRSAGGYTRARVQQASQPLHSDQWVWVFEPDDKVMGPAQVINVGTEFVHLAVQWGMLIDDPYGFSMPNGWVDVDKIYANLSDKVKGVDDGD